MNFKGRQSFLFYFAPTNSILTSSRIPTSLRQFETPNKAAACITWNRMFQDIFLIYRFRGVSDAVFWRPEEISVYSTLDLINIFIRYFFINHYVFGF
jgi:hypothetical protein